MQDRASSQPLTKQELKTLLVDLEKQQGIHSMLNLILSSGMSLEDALSIRLGDIDYTNSLVKLEGRKRIVKLPYRVMALLLKYQNWHTAPEIKLYGIDGSTAIAKLNDLSRIRLGRSVSWSGIRHTWAVLAFARNISFNQMLQTSGASAKQLAVWNFYGKENGHVHSDIDLLAEIYTKL